MRRSLLILTILLSLLSVSGFVPLQSATVAQVVILNRAGQPTVQFTDGDGIQIQVTLPQPVSEATSVTFLLDAASDAVGTCLIASGSSACQTERFFSLGWFWGGDPQHTRTVQAIHANGTLLGQSDPLTVKPRPVVMVHGFISNADTWQAYQGPAGFLASLGISGFAVGDGQVPGKLNTGDMLNPAGRTNTIAQNAAILGQYITNVKQKTGAEMVDLVVHSMGGMISRYYIDRVMEDRDVAQLIMLGSPMGGSDCAVLPAALGFYLPASIEIRESYMTGVFNQQITHRRGIAFYDLAGTAILESFKSPCADIPNDTVVSVRSVNAITLQSSQLPDIHSDLTLSAQAFQDYVKPLLQRTAPTFLSEPDPAAPPQTESPLEFTRVYTGHVDVGGSTDITINIEPGLSVASFALYDASRSVTTVVRGASGNLIELAPETNGFIKIDDPSAMFYLGYGFKNPKPGPWRITVQATETTPSVGADFAISVYFVGGAKLEATSSTLVPQLKEQVALRANLTLNGQPLVIQAAQAVLKDADGKSETLNFSTGQNAAATWIPTRAGTYAVDIIVTGVAPDGTLVERTDFLALEAQPEPSQGQIKFNLVAVIAGVVFLVVLILLFLLRGARKLIRKR